MFIINAEIRQEKGKSENRRLRKVNKFPAIIYSNSVSTAVPIKINQDLMMNLQVKSKFYYEPLIIVVNNQKIKVKVQEIQRHPFKPKLQHIDFIRI